jgi:glycosyltransferase involved in cell wall biosynthesis
VRIALFSHFYPPLNNAGAEQYTHGLARELMASGHEVRVFCVGNWQTGETYFQGYEDDEWEGVPVRRLHLNWMLAPDPNGNLIDNPVSRLEAKHFLEAFRPDVVHITSLYSLSSSVLESIQELNIPILFTLTDYWIICTRHTLVRGDGSLCDGHVAPQTCLSCLLHDRRPYQILRLALGKRWTPLLIDWISHTPAVSNQRGFLGAAIDVEQRQTLLRKRLAFVDIIISPSQFVANQCRIDGFPEEIVLSRHGMKLDWLSQYYPMPSEGNLIRLGYIGQINPLKGVDVLVKEFIMGDFDSQMTLSIHGKLDQHPDYTRSVQQMAHGYPHIRFMGPYLRHQLGQVLSEIDVLIVPSTWPENAPLVVQEAFAAKIPVIASNMGGLPEFVHHDVNGLLFDPRQPGSLLVQLQRLQQEGHSLLERLRSGIPPVPAIADEAQHLLELYRRAIKARQSSQV